MTTSITALPTLVGHLLNAPLFALAEGSFLSQGLCLFLPLCPQHHQQGLIHSVNEWGPEGINEWATGFGTLSHSVGEIQKLRSSNPGKWKAVIIVSPPRLPKMPTASIDLWQPVANYATVWKKTESEQRASYRESDGDSLEKWVFWFSKLRVVSHPPNCHFQPKAADTEGGLSEFWVWGAICMADLRSSLWLFFFFLIYLFIYFNWRLITLQYCSGFCHTFTWISHGCTCIPHPEPPSHLPPHPIPQGLPSAPAPSTLSRALNLDSRSISHVVI